MKRPRSLSMTPSSQQSSSSRLRSASPSRSPRLFPTFSTTNRSPLRHSRRRFLPIVPPNTSRMAPCMRPLIFFDAQPDDTLIYIIQLLSRQTAPSASLCPLLNLAQVSPNLRRLIAAQLGSRLAFSVCADSAWFWAWLSVAGRHLKHLLFHTRPFLLTSQRHICAPTITSPPVYLDSTVALRAVCSIQPKLVELDVTGLHKPSLAAVEALQALLCSVRKSLTILKLDINFPQVARAVAIARLFELRRLTVVNANSHSNNQLLSLLRGLRRRNIPGEPIVCTELTLDACDTLPGALLSSGSDFGTLLAKVQNLHLDFDDELDDSERSTPATTNRMLSLFSLPDLRTLTLSGSGVPITRHLLSGLRTRCTALSDLRLIDCDIEPASRRRRVHSSNTSEHESNGVNVLQMGTTANMLQAQLESEDYETDEASENPDEEALPIWANLPENPIYHGYGEDARIVRACRTVAAAGQLLTQYYPRWVTFDVRLLNALATHCPRLTHLRVFTAPGAEAALRVLAARLSDTLIDLDVYPKLHERKDEMAGEIVQFVTSLRALERVCLVTLDLSAEQLITVLQHCGPRLKSFAFSPPLSAESVRDLSAKVMADVLIAAANYAPELEKVEVIFPHDWPPTVETRRVMERVNLAVTTLEAQCRNLDMVNIRSLVNRMTPCTSDGEDMFSDGDESISHEGIRSIHSDGEGDDADVFLWGIEDNSSDDDVN